MLKIYRTPQAKRDYKEIYKESARRFGEKVASETVAQIESAERRIQENPHYGRLDPQFHSEKYRYIQTKNRQKIFYVAFSDFIVIITAGYDGRNWLRILQEQDAYITEQLHEATQRRNEWNLEFWLIWHEICL